MPQYGSSTMSPRRTHARFAATIASAGWIGVSGRPHAASALRALGSARKRLSSRAPLASKPAANAPGRDDDDDFELEAGLSQFAYQGR